MTNQEFSNEFDILYNNITSNQAPGLNEYEKSVFLTKAQDEIIKAYFNPKTNKVQEGFDGSERRQIDFSMLVKVASFEAHRESEKSTEASTNELSPSEPIDPVIIPFGKAAFDNNDNSKSVNLGKLNILMIINEYILVTRDSDTKDVRLTVIPISYNEYDRIMSKPFKRPTKFNAWRLLNSSDLTNTADLIVGPNDTIKKYVVRYVKRPKPIILANAIEGDLTIDGENKETPCELDPILHPELLQRAVELASAVYKGDLSTQLALGQVSQTEMGMVTQGGK